MGGTIDIIVTCSADVVSQVNTFETGLSDHLLLQFNINLESPAACYIKFLSRPWRKLDLNQFRIDLHQSLNTAMKEVPTSVDEMIGVFDNITRSVLDQHVPEKTISRRRRSSDAWFDDECRQQKRCVRRLERRFKRTFNESDRAYGFHHFDRCTSLTIPSAVGSGADILSQKRQPT